MQDPTLDDLLDAPEGQQTAPEAPQPVQQGEPPAPMEPTGDKPHDTAPPADVAPGAGQDVVPRKAVLDERRKRQELEARLKELEARLQPQQQHEPAPPPDWYAAPDQAAAHFQQEMQQRLYQTAVYQSEMVMRQKHEDYDEVSALFADAAQQDHRLAVAVFQHPFPAEYAYQVGKQLKLMQEIGNDPGAYRAKLEAEILARHGIQSGQNAVAAAPRNSAVPRSLGRDVSQQPRNARGQFDGPAPLDELLG